MKRQIKCNETGPIIRVCIANRLKNYRDDGLLHTRHETAPQSAWLELEIKVKKWNKVELRRDDNDEDRRPTKKINHEQTNLTPSFKSCAITVRGVESG